MSATKIGSELVFGCNTCGKTFRKYASLRLHRKWKHEINPPSRTCFKCEKVFNDSSALKRHVLVIHNGDPDADPRPHASIITAGNADVKAFKFHTYKDFCDWKDRTERETLAKYVRQRGSRMRKDGSSVTIFNCHRDGYFHPKGKMIRRNRLMGTSKINSHCPSHIRVTQKNNTFLVSYLPTHSGHSVDPSKFSISRKDDDRTSKLLEKNVPLDDILDNVRNSILSGHIISRKHLPTYIDKFVINDEMLSDCSGDSVICDLLLKYQDLSNFILLYKPQDMEVESCPQLTLDDICLIVANNQQLDILQNYSRRCVCLDVLPTTFDNLYLYSLLVLNDHNNAVPCAFMFSNLKNSKILEVFYRTIQSALGCTLPTAYFMSSLSENLNNVWKEVNPSQCKFLSTRWKVDHEWRNLLKLINRREKQVEVYRLLKTVEFEEDIHSFNGVTEHLKKELSDNSETVKFVEKYKSYLENPESWALCHQFDIDPEGSTGLENIHIILKNLCLKMNFIKSIDSMVLSLLRFSCLKYYDTLLNLPESELKSKVSEIKVSHDDSVSMGSVYLEEVAKLSWTIKGALSNDQTSYKIMRRMETCNCRIECPECLICVHLFTCTCPDFVVNWTMCKHIHLVACWLKCKVIEVQEDPATEEVVVKEESPDVNWVEMGADDFQDVMDEEIEIPATYQDSVKEESTTQEVFIMDDEDLSEEVVFEDAAADIPEDTQQKTVEHISVEDAQVIQDLQPKGKHIIVRELDISPVESAKDRVLVEPSLQVRKKELSKNMKKLVSLIENEEQYETVTKHISMLLDIIQTPDTSQPIDVDHTNVLNNSFFTNQVVQTVLLTPEQQSLLKSDMEVPIEFIKYQVVQFDD